MSVTARAPHTLPHSRPPELTPCLRRVSSISLSPPSASLKRSYPIPPGYKDLIFFNTSVGDYPITVMVDSGSSVSTIRYDLVQELNLPISSYTDVPITAFNGGLVPIAEQVSATIRFNSSLLTHTFLVFGNSAVQSLIGIDFLRQHQIDIRYSKASLHSSMHGEVAWATDMVQPLAEGRLLFSVTSGVKTLRFDESKNKIPSRLFWLCLCSSQRSRPLPEYYIPKSMVFSYAV